MAEEIVGYEPSAFGEGVRKAMQPLYQEASNVGDGAFKFEVKWWYARDGKVTGPYDTEQEAWAKFGKRVVAGKSIWLNTNDSPLTTASLHRRVVKLEEGLALIAREGCHSEAREIARKALEL